MRNRVVIAEGVVAVVGALLAGCAALPRGDAGQALRPPQVQLQRVEVASYFPYAPPPARVPLILAFIYNITNPNGVAVGLEDFKFTVAFEAVGKGEFFPLITPIVYERLWTPPGITNQLRVTATLDSLIVPATLAVSAGVRVQRIGLKPGEMVKDWWEKIGDFAYGIRVTEGTALFTSNGLNVLSTFEGNFPK
ncbi:MAG: hypothetical protein HYV08_08845 [Deltaproteobacteria bacterium]|nr:hypothetical protein [Deltaproteobacteria bacterium]MBI3076198.1 hypothetical protein [Deltaproteobacteria bacterium]